MVKKINFITYVILAFLFIHNAYSGGVSASLDASSVTLFAKNLREAILAGNNDYVNLMMPKGEFLSQADYEFVFGESRSVRNILLSQSLKIDFRRVDDWTKSNRELYQIFYFTDQLGNLEKLDQLNWMEGYAVCLFEYDTGVWSIPKTLCYNETDWEQSR